MHGSQQLTRGAIFQAVDNGGDRNCHFLGFTRISKFFAFTEEIVIFSSKGAFTVSESQRES